MSGWVAGAVAVSGAVNAWSSNKASKRATNAADDAAARSDALETAKFEEAKKQAEILRQRGDEAAAVALEEATRAELGAQKFEALSNQYAGKADDYAKQFQTYAGKADAAAAEREALARRAYVGVDKAANAKQAAGQAAQQDILGAARGVNDAAAGFDARLSAAGAAGDNYLSSANATGQQYLTDAFGNIQERFSPFVDSERRARGQMDVELGLAEGDPNKGYRNTSAYMAAQDASRVAQEEAIGTIDQAAGNSGTLYSGTRGAALVDRSTRGSYERAGIEQSYYQNYMDMLKSMADPTSTNLVSGYENTTASQKAQLEAQTAAQRAQLGMSTAGQIGSAYMDAAGTGLNAQVQASQTGLNSMRTGQEGLELMAYLDPGTAGASMTSAAADAHRAGADIALSGFDSGTAGSPYRLGAQDYRIQGAGGAGSTILSNMPTGTNGSNYRFAGVEASNAALADLAGGVTDMATAYMMYGPKSGPSTATPAYLGQPQTQTAPYQTPTRLYA